MTRVNFFSLLLIISVIMFLPFTTKAQVTIGSAYDPQPFSVLELFSNNERGFRLPQLTSGQRDILEANLPPLDANGVSPAMGLQIFNTCNQCVETWNGERWISFCFGEPQRPPFTPPTHFDPTCAEDEYCIQLADFAATVRQLNDGTPQLISHIALPDFNMMPVTGGFFYMGVEAINDASPNFDEDFKEGLRRSLESPDEMWDDTWDLLAPFFNVHLAGVSSFYIGETVVTRELFDAVMDFSGNVAFDGSTHNLAAIEGLSASWADLVADDLPRTNVSWYEAIVFMNRLSAISGRKPVYELDCGSYFLNLVPTGSLIVPFMDRNGFRLPTETEWEYAARGGQMNEYTRTRGASGEQFLYSGTNIENLDEFAWHWGNSSRQLQPVRTRASNELGIFDMSGNVWEWVWDWFDFYPECCSVNSEGPDEVSEKASDILHSLGGQDRIVRGGSWGTHDLKVSFRNSFPFLAYQFPEYYVGFRIATSAQ